jgi:hypothetical protein
MLSSIAEYYFIILMVSFNCLKRVCDAGGAQAHAPAGEENRAWRRDCCGFIKYALRVP